MTAGRGRLIGDFGGHRIGQRHQVANAFELAAGAQRQIERRARGPEHTAQMLHEFVRVDVLAIHAGHRDDDRRPGVARRVPSLARNDFDALGRVHRQHGAIRTRKADHHAAQEVDKPRRVDEVDMLALPGQVAHRRMDAFLRFFRIFIVVADRGAVRHRAQAFDLLARQQHGLGQHGLATARMPDDGNVAQVFGLVRSHDATP